MTTNPSNHIQMRPSWRDAACTRVFVAGALFLGACSDPPASGDEALDPSATTLAQSNPGEAVFAEVRANGTGCPPGTANTRISSDGLVFTTTFSNYVTQVDPSADLSVRDCQLDITLRVPEGRSYSVQSFSYSGYALLQEGVIGRQTAHYYFSGQPVPPLESNRTELRGPHEAAYLFKDDVSEDKREWSPCGVERNLNVVTRVQLFNSSPRRSGYMNLTSVDGSSRMVLKLDSRPCSATPDVGGALTKVSQVSVQPSTIRRDQPFVVRWTSPAENSGANYRVQVRTPVSFGDTVIWESPETTSSSMRYGGSPLPLAGVYEVVVIARRGKQEQVSDRVRLEVRDGGSGTLAPPTELRVQPSPVQRDQPFVVSWARGNATPTTIYRVEVREPREAGFAVVASAPETTGSLAAFEPSIIPRAGTYQIVVLARDGGVESASAPLTIQVVDANRAQPGSPLLGRYAARVQSFWQMSDRVRPVRELYLVEFARAGDDIEMRARVCDQETVTPGATLSLVSPEAIPEFRRKVVIEGSSWRTDGQPIGVSYAREGVPACAGRAGQYVMKDPSQRWIRGSTCRCPRSASDAPTLEDCRVVDIDGDRQPGMTYELFTLGRTARLEYHVASVRSHPVRGVIDPGGAHSAQWEVDEVGFKLGCSTTALCDTGTGGDVPCASNYNRIDFAPLREPPSGQAEWTCSTLRSSQSRLFPQQPSTPSRCQTDSVTGN